MVVTQKISQRIAERKCEFQHIITLGGEHGEAGGIARRGGIFLHQATLVDGTSHQCHRARRPVQPQQSLQYYPRAQAVRGEGEAARGGQKSPAEGRDRLANGDRDISLEWVIDNWYK